MIAIAPDTPEPEEESEAQSVESQAPTKPKSKPEGKVAKRHQESNIRERIAYDVLPAIPKDAEPKHQQIILLLGVGKSQSQVAQMTSTGPQTVCRIANEHRDDILLVKAKTAGVMRGIATANVLQYQIILGAKLDAMTAASKPPSPQELKTIGGAVESVYRIAHLLSLQSESGDVSSATKRTTASAKDIAQARRSLVNRRAELASMGPKGKAPAN